MAWPTGTIPVTHLDQDSDSPLQARPALKQVVDQVNIIRENAVRLDQLTSSARVQLLGSFNSNAHVDFVKIGNVVTMTSVGQVSHTSSTGPYSTSFVVPPQFRPSNNIWNAYTDYAQVTVTHGGQVGLKYATARTTSGEAFTVSYVITS